DEQGYTQDGKKIYIVQFSSTGPKDKYYITNYPNKKGKTKFLTCKGFPSSDVTFGDQHYDMTVQKVYNFHHGLPPAEPVAPMGKNKPMISKEKDGTPSIVSKTLLKRYGTN